MQKISSFHLFIPQIQSILKSRHLTSHNHCWPCSPQISNHLLICANLYQAAKNLLIPPVYSWDTINFRDHRPDWLHPFLIMPNQKYFDQLFINLYQHAKNEAVSWIYSGEIVDLKILQSGCLRAFWPISREHDFSNRICAETQQIKQIFIIKQIQCKLMTKFFVKFKKTFFLAISSIFGAKKVFSNNPDQSRTTSNGFLAPCRNSKKSNDSIPRKHPDRTHGTTGLEPTKA